MSGLKITSVALTIDHITFCKGKGNTSRYIRGLIDREIGQEHASKRCEVLLKAYQNVLNRHQEISVRDVSPEKSEMKRDDANA